MKSFRNPIHDHRIRPVENPSLVPCPLRPLQANPGSGCAGPGPRNVAKGDSAAARTELQSCRLHEAELYVRYGDQLVAAKVIEG